jgi:hypothetical protein
MVSLSRPTRQVCRLRKPMLFFLDVLLIQLLRAKSATENFCYQHHSRQPFLQPTLSRRSLTFSRHRHKLFTPSHHKPVILSSSRGHCSTWYQFDLQTGFHNPHPSNPTARAPNEPHLHVLEICSTKMSPSSFQQTNNYHSYWLLPLNCDKSQ